MWRVELLMSTPGLAAADSRRDHLVDRFIVDEAMVKLTFWEVFGNRVHLAIDHLVVKRLDGERIDGKRQVARQHGV